MSPCYSLDARLASKMPILFYSDNGRLGAALFRSLSQASQYAMLLPAVYFSTSSFSSNIEHLLQVGNAHLKHLYLVLMKQEKHISIMLCDVSSDFRHSLSAFSSPKAALPLVSTKRRAASRGEIAFPVAKLSLYSACLSGVGGGGGGNSTWQMGSMYFCDICPIYHI